MIANVTGDTASMAMPANVKLFKVDHSTFRRFEKGRQPFERWKKYLDIEENETHRAIYDCARKNSVSNIILQSEEIGCYKIIRRGKS